jgi:hypothetical protein
VSAPLATFSATGGAPPASREVVRVARDGTVRVLVGTAWVDDAPADQAGLFEWSLPDEAAVELAELVTRIEPRGEEGGGGDAGRLALAWPGGRVRWGPYDDVPEPLDALAARFAELRIEARRHPLAAVRLSLEPPLDFRFEARGSEAVGLTVRAVSARVVPAGEGTDPPPLLWAREAARLSVAVPGPTSIAPGETLVVSAGTSVPQGRSRVDGFAHVTLDLPGEAAEVVAVLAAGPLITRPPATS